MDPKNQAKPDHDFLAGIILGSIVGATLAILLGTEEGSDFRHKLKKKGRQLLEDLPDLMSEKTHELEEKISSPITNIEKKGKKLLSHLSGNGRTS